MSALLDSALRGAALALGEGLIFGVPMVLLGHWLASRKNRELRLSWKAVIGVTLLTALALGVLYGGFTRHAALNSDKYIAYGY